MYMRLLPFLNWFTQSCSVIVSASSRVICFPYFVIRILSIWRIFGICLKWRRWHSCKTIIECYKINMLKYFVIEKKIDFMLTDSSTRIIHKEQKKINAKIWIPAVRISLRRSMDSGNSCFSLHRTPVQSARMWLLFCVAKHGVMTLG